MFVQMCVTSCRVVVHECWCMFVTSCRGSSGICVCVRTCVRDIGSHAYGHYETAAVSPGTARCATYGTMRSERE